MFCGICLHNSFFLQFYIIEIFEILQFIPKKLGKMNERKYETPAKMVYSPSTKSLADMEKNIFGDISFVTKTDIEKKRKLKRKSRLYR